MTGKTGRVSLVGAGPGDPSLITLAGLERIREADVIVYDRLVSPRLLDHAREDAERLYVGKLPGEGHDQPAISALLVERAREGKRVVRLKGGDPFVFGRGGEEAEALRAAGVPFDVVPGVTSATAVPAYAGIPVTHRGVASSFAVVTGHEGEPSVILSGDEGVARNDEPPRRNLGRGSSRSQEATAHVDWDRIANAADTLVLLMGVATLADTAGKLVAAGRPPDTPVAVIRWGTTPEQRTVTGTLADIADRVREAGLTPPAVTVVGEAVRLRETLAWFENRPLFGKRVLITRTRKQAGVLARLLAEEGAIPIELPSIEIVPEVDVPALEAAVGRLREGGYAWAVFTSANAVEALWPLLRDRGLDARALGGVRVAAIGPATAAALEARGITADAVPEEYVAEALVGALRETFLPAHPEPVEGASGPSTPRILVPRAAGARPELIDGLQALGAEVDEVTLYRAAVPERAPAEALSLLRDGAIDIVTFTASSTVRNLAALLGDDFSVILSGHHVRAGKVVPSRRNLGRGAKPALADERPGPLIACIGPITAAAARELGLRVDVVAPEHTVEGLVRAVREEYGG